MGYSSTMMLKSLTALVLVSAISVKHYLVETEEKRSGRFLTGKDSSIGEEPGEDYNDDYNDDPGSNSPPANPPPYVPAPYICGARGRQCVGRSLVLNDDTGSNSPLANPPPIHPGDYKFTGGSWNKKITGHQWRPATPPPYVPAPYICGARGRQCVGRSLVLNDDTGS